MHLHFKVFGDHRRRENVLVGSQIFMDMYFFIINFFIIQYFICHEIFFQSLILTVTINQKVVKTKQQTNKIPDLMWDSKAGKWWLDVTCHPYCKIKSPSCDDKDHPTSINFAHR